MLFENQIKKAEQQAQEALKNHEVNPSTLRQIVINHYS